MTKKKEDKPLFEQQTSQMVNLVTNETTVTMQPNDISQQDFFEQTYKDLHFYNYDLFCILTPDRIASSAEFGFIAPSDKVNWNEPIEFFPEYDLSEVAKLQTKACVYVKVPLKWAMFCKISKENRLVFKSNLNLLFLFAEVKEYYVSSNFQKEVESKLFTYEYSISFGSSLNWKHRNSNKLQLLTTQDPGIIDKMLGGIIVSSIEEIFGKLIDSGRIPLNSKYIEPFTSYEISEKSDKVLYDTILLGNQGFGLIYSLMRFLESGNLEKISEIESRYFNIIQKQGYIPLKETKASLHTSLIWYAPLIFKHFESLKEGNAKLFRAELQNIMKSNNIEHSVENQWAVVIFAGFSAKGRGSGCAR